MIQYKQECIMKKGERGEERDTTTHLIKNSIFTHTSRVTKFSMLILRGRQRSDLYSQMTRPFRGFEIVSKLTEDPKNRPEAFVEPWDRL
jgi:hypothetical protein